MIRALVLTVFTALTASAATAQANDQILIRIGTVAPEGTPWERQMKRTRKRINKDAGDSIKLKVYLGGKKGDEKSLVRQCRDGHLEMVGVSTASLATQVPALQVLEFPFLFDSSEEADFVLDNYLREPVTKILAKRGYVFFQWAENGWLNFGVKDSFIKRPEDLAGRKIRSQESPVHIAAWKGLGASPVEMSVSEVLPALKTGLVDGFAQTPLFTFAAGWHQGIKHYTVSRHVYQPAILVFSKKFYDKLTPEVQKTLMSNIAEEEQQARSDVRKIEPGLIQNFVNYGINVYKLTPEERAAFKKRADAFRAKYMKTSASAEQKALLKAVNRGKAAFKKKN